MVLDQDRVFGKKLHYTVLYDHVQDATVFNTSILLT